MNVTWIASGRIASRHVRRILSIVTSRWSVTSLRGPGERNFNAVSHKQTRAPIQSVPISFGLWDTALQFLSPGPRNDVTDHLVITVTPTPPLRTMLQNTWNGASLPSPSGSMKYHPLASLMYDLTSWHVLGCFTWDVFIIGSVVANIVNEGCIPCVVYTILIVRSIWLVGIS